MSKITKRFILTLVAIFAIVSLVACNEVVEEVNFHVDDEVVLTSEISDEGVVVFPTEPEKDGYNFVGWYDKKSGEGTKYTNESDFKDSLDLYAYFEEVLEDVEYTATFKVDGENVEEITFTDPNVELNEPQIAEKEGYTANWESYDLKEENIVINAVYTLIEYKINFLDEEGELIEAVPFTIESEEITEPALPNKEGYDAVWGLYELYVLEDQDVSPKFNAITYYATFVGGAESDIVAAEVPFDATDLNVVAPDYVPRNPGHVGQWEEFTLTLSDITVNAEYSVVPNYLEVYPDTEYIDAKDIVDQLVADDNLKDYDEFLGLGNLVPNVGTDATTSFANDEVHLVSTSERPFQYERVSGPNQTTYTHGGNKFVGFLKFGGSSSIDGRYIKLTPSVGATISLWITNPGAYPEHMLLLLSELKDPILLDEEGNPNDEGLLDDSIIVDRATTTNSVEKVSFDLIGGQTYYIWSPHNPEGYTSMHGNKFIRGLEYIHEPVDKEMKSIELDTTEVVKEFPVDGTFNYENLKVLATDANNEVHEVLNEDRFVVSTPDMSVMGQATVTVTFGDDLIATYEIDILGATEHTATFKSDGNDVLVVDFTSSDTELSNVPDIPARDGYTSVGWEEYTLPIAEDLVINAIYEAIDYTASFLVDGVVYDTVTFGVDHPTNVTRVALKKVPFRQGFVGEWETFVLKDVFEDIEVNAVYTDNSNEYVVKSQYERSLIDGKKIRDKAVEMGVEGIEDKISGNIQTEKDPETGLGKSIILGANDEFTFGINRAIQFDRVDTFYSRENEEFYGRYKAGGGTHPNDRWIKINPLEDAVLSLFGLYVSGSSQKVWLLSELVDPTVEANSDKIVQTETSTSSLRNRFFDLEGGKEYYLWFGGNQHISGIRLEYSDKVFDLTTADLTLDTTNVKKTFALNEEFNFDNLVVSFEEDAKDSIVLNEGEYTVSTPDLTTAGTKTVTVTYGENKTIEYDIVVE